jgi:hypothetical protein
MFRGGHGEARARLFADVLIRVKVGLRHCMHEYQMTEDLTPSSSFPKFESYQAALSSLKDQV